MRRLKKPKRDFLTGYMSLNKIRLHRRTAAPVSKCTPALSPPTDESEKMPLRQGPIAKPSDVLYGQRQPSCQKRLQRIHHARRKRMESMKVRAVHVRNSTAILSVIQALTRRDR